MVQNILEPIIEIKWCRVKLIDQAVLITPEKETTTQLSHPYETAGTHVKVCITMT